MGLFQNLKSLSIPQTVETIEEGAFDGCKLTKIECDAKNLKYVTGSTETLETVHFIEGTEAILKKDCEPFVNVKNVVLPFSATRIEDIFLSNELKSITCHPKYLNRFGTDVHLEELIVLPFFFLIFCFNFWNLM